VGSSSTIGESTGSRKSFLSARSQADPFLDNRLPSYDHGRRTEEETMAEALLFLVGKRHDLQNTVRWLKFDSGNRRGWSRISLYG
jgi:erythromycin esterase-like protein